MIEHALIGILLLLAAYGLYWSYAKIANKRYGTQLDAVQAVMYSPDLSGFPLSDRIKNYLLRSLFKWPALLFVIIGITQFVLIFRK